MSLVSIRECAQALKVSERHVRRMLDEGQWPFHRVGYRIIRLNLEEIIDQSKDAGDGHRRSMNNES